MKQESRKNVETESDSSSSSQEQDKKHPTQMKKLYKLQSLLNKPVQQLTDDEKKKRSILSKISGLLEKDNTTKLLKPINSSINQELKLTLNINQTKNAQMPKITSNQTDTDKEYVDYLMLKKFKQQQIARDNNNIKQQVKENYEQLWQEEQEQSDREIKDTYNVNKALKLVHFAEIEKEKLLKSISEERLYHKKGYYSSSVPNSNLQSLSNSRLILMQDQDINETECREQQIRRTHKKLKTVKVIKIIQAATKKIYNKKQDQIEKEVIMHQVQKQLNQTKKTSSKQIDSIFRKTQSDEAFQTSQNHQKLITNKLMSENKFYLLPKNTFLKPIQTKNYQQMESKTEDSIPRFHHRKISHMNDKIVNLVSQIDQIQKGELEQISFIKQMENEQDLYKTFRESLQPDQIQETLKSLLAPNKNNYNKPFRFNNKRFFNQLM